MQLLLVITSVCEMTCFGMATPDTRFEAPAPEDLPE
jgi:hypothetical protein